jgi:glycosyltransferase involved in cell wall biosynthesis
VKILHVIASMNPVSGGPCEVIRNSMPVLDKLEVYKEVVCLDDPGELFLKKDSFPIHALGPGKTAWCYNSSLLSWLLENLERFDFVIVNGLWLYHAFAVRKALKTLKSLNKKNKVKKNLPKVYIMPHGMLDPYFQKASHRRLKAIRNWFYWKLFEKKVINEADGLLFTCETELQLAREPFHPYKPKKEFNVGLGVWNPPAFEAKMKAAFAAKCPTAARKPYLLFLSRIHDKKGVDLLVEAYMEIIQEIQQSKVDFDPPMLVIAGPGVETPFGQNLQQMVSKTKETSHLINFPGMLTGDAKWGAFYGCDAFILPSHQENFGIAVAEALSCSKPVLISREVNIWQVISEFEGGIIDEDTLEGTKNLIVRWLRLDSNKKQLMGQNALKAFQEHFAIEPATKKLLSALTE